MTLKQKKTTVYFVPTLVQYADDRDILVLETILAHRGYRFLSCFERHEVVGVKACENDPALTRRYAQAFVRLLKRQGYSTFVCHTSNRHLDHRSNGLLFAQKTMDACQDKDEMAPVRALDGVYGEHEISRKFSRSLEGDVYLAGELPNIDGVVSVSTFTSASETKPCGSIVNLGQGLASKKGKIHQRTTVCPQVNVAQCYACRRCTRACPTNAITIVEGHATIDTRKCIKCGKCVENAYSGDITYDWNAPPEHYYQSVAKHAKGALAVLRKMAMCVNIVMQNDSQGPSFAGGMVSHDPVAVDCATVEFCENNQLLSSDTIRRMRAQIEAAVCAGVGSANYKTETVAY